jgi:hypothetical protein
MPEKIGSPIFDNGWTALNRTGTNGIDDDDDADADR